MLKIVEESQELKGAIKAFNEKNSMDYKAVLQIYGDEVVLFDTRNDGKRIVVIDRAGVFALTNKSSFLSWSDLDLLKAIKDNLEAY